MKNKKSFGANIRNFTDCLKRDEIPKCTLEGCTGTIKPGTCIYLFYCMRGAIYPLSPGNKTIN